MRQDNWNYILQQSYVGVAAAIFTIVLASVVYASPNNTFQLTAAQNLTSHPGLQAQTLLNSAPRLTKMRRRKNTTAQATNPQLAGQQLYQSLNQKYSASLVNKKPRKTPLISTAQQENLKALNSKLQYSGGVTVTFSKVRGTPTYIKPHGASIKPSFSGLTAVKPSKNAVAMQFLSENRALLKLEDPTKELVLVNQSTDTQDKTHFSFQQTINGVPVWGKQVLVHLDKNDGVYLFQGRYEPTQANLNTKPKITAQNSINKVLDDLNISGSLSEPADSELVVYTKNDGTPVLTFKVEVSPAIDERWIYFINAETSAISHKIFNIHKNLVSASGTDLNGQNKTFNAWYNSSDATYYLIDPSTPTAAQNLDPVTDGPQSIGDTYILHANNGDGSSLFFNKNGTQTSWQDPAAVSAAYNTRQVYDYYLNTFSRNSIDGNGKNLMVVIHYKQNHDNAFWNGAYMVYGDGGTIFSPLAGCLDVAGHEMTHGVIENSANLIYENQSGALNESFADVFGAMIDRGDWLVGEDCTIASPGYLRDMQNPSNGLGGQPTHMDEYQNLPNTPSGDNGGVHVNSGIPNRAAYLIAEGLSTESLGTSIGRADTEQIYYRALTIYLTQSSQFIDARRALFQAAEDLHGQGSIQSQAVATAFDAVGITDNGTTTPPDTTPTPTDPISGDDVMVYLYPRDGTHDNPSEDFDLYAQTMGNPFTGYDPVLDTGPFNVTGDLDLPAAYTKPAAYTGSAGTDYYYIASDNNIYFAVLNGTDIQMTTSGVISSFTISPDGRYVAYTSIFTTDNNLYVIDLNNGGAVSSYPIISQNYQGGGAVTSNTILYADALSFDYTSNTIVFDALNCQSTPDSLCSNGAGLNYWSIGIFEINSARFFFPFPGQSPDIDLGYPSFAANNNFVITLDLLDYTNFSTSGLVSSEAIAINFEQQIITSVYSFGLNTSEFWSAPSFWGGDDFITMQVPASASQSGLISASRRTIDSNWQGTGSLEDVNIYGVAMPMMHRAGQRVISGGLTPSTSILNFGNGSMGGSSQLTLTLTNSGNSDVNISNITSNNNNFTHNGVNTRVPRNQSVTITVTYTATQAGTQAGSLVIENDGQGGNVVISLTGTATSGDTIAPVVTPPANITVAAISASGTVASDPAIAVFLNGATATDNVGLVGAVTNDAPATFPAGTTTTVTFSATDAAGNIGMATAMVTIGNYSSVGGSSGGGGGGGAFSLLSLLIMLFAMLGVRLPAADFTRQILRTRD